MIHTPPRLETDLPALAKQAIALAAHERNEPLVWRRNEMLVTLPERGQVPCDSACEILDSPDCYGVLEAKRKLNRELMEQALRWSGFVNLIWVTYEAHKSYKAGPLWMRDRLDRAGVGRVVIVDGVVSYLYNAVFQQADTRLFAQAYHASTGDIDPPAGSAAALRATPARTRWEAIRQYIRSNNGVSLKDIRRDVKGERRTTAAQVRKAIDTKELLGCWYEGTRTTFYGENGK